MWDPRDAPERIQALGAWWDALARAGPPGGGPPERAAVDIAQLKPLLPYLMLMEFRTDPFVVRYRLTGTKIDEWVGTNVTGRTLNEFLATDKTGASAYLMSCYEHCWRTGEPVVGAYDWPSVSGNPLRIWFGMYPLKLDGAIRQCLVIEDFESLSEDAEPLPWLAVRGGR